MCIKPASVATVAALAALALTSPASAGILGGGKDKAAKNAPKTSAKDAGAEATAPRKATTQERAAVQRLEPLGRVAFWSREMQIDPMDAEAGVKLATALRQLGRNEEAATIAGQVLITHPDNVDALLEDARAKIAGGQPFYAIAPLNQAKAIAPKDWRPLSLLGVAMEQTQRPEEAQAAYLAALQLSPENPAVLSNFALFRAARGQKDEAELLLRRAVASPASGPAERQNLALVLGLQGKLTEAERLMRQDLPPHMAEANLAYLKGGGAPPTAAEANRNWAGVGASPQ